MIGLNLLSFLVIFLNHLLGKDMDGYTSGFVE
jgi:hypothetical protein